MTSIATESYAPTIVAHEQRWPVVAVWLAIAVLAALFLQRELVLHMVSVWTVSDTFTHCFFVVPTALWLVYLQRDKLLKIQPKPSLLALPLLCGIAAIGFLADILAIRLVQHVMLVASVIALVAGIIGWRASRVISFPLLFLFFAAPVGDELVPLLMEVTADLTVLAVQIVGIPVFREGLYFTLPSGHWSVVEACSGISYLIASVTLGCVYAHLELTTIRRQVLFVLLAAAVPTIANGIRAFIIVMLSHFSNNTLAKGFDHLVYGWLFFGFVMLVLFALGGWLKRGETSARKAQLGDSADSNRDKFTEHVFSDNAVQSGRKAVAWRHRLATTAGLLIAVSSLWPLATLALAKHDTQNTGSAVHVEPMVIGEMLGLSPTVSYSQPHGSATKLSASAQPEMGWVPEYTGQDASADAIFRVDAETNLYINVRRYDGQRQGHELVSRQNQVVSQNSDWQQRADAVVEFNTQRYGRVSVNRTVLQRGAESRTMWWWFNVDGEDTTNRYVAQLLGAKSRVLMHQAPGFVVFISTNASSSRVDDWIETHFESLFRQVREQTIAGYTN